MQPVSGDQQTTIRVAPCAAADDGPIVERGPWRARADDRDDCDIWIESDDFTHDVQLSVSGDFADAAQKLAYAEEIARRLNAWRPTDVE